MRAASRFALWAGVVAGVLIPLVLLIDGATRPGYSVWRNGASQLGLGDRGWIQTVNFVAGGLLLLVFAMGVRQALQRGQGSTSAPLLIAATGVGLVVAGLVPTDPALGYPPGAAETVTTAGRIHSLAGLLVFGGLSALAFVVASRLRPTRRDLARYALVTGVLVAALAIGSGVAYRLDLAGVVTPGSAGVLEHAALVAGFGWVAVFGVWLQGRSQR